MQQRQGRKLFLFICFNDKKHRIQYKDLIVNQIWNL